MGTWGTGNFQSDGALDCVGDLCLKLAETVDGILARPGDADADGLGESHLVPSVAILALLCGSCGGSPPEPARVREWRERYLEAYDRTMPELGPKPGFLEERRAVIAATFAELEHLADRFWQV